MSARRARRILWTAAALLLPLPYWILADGCVPVVRFALLGGISTAYAAGVDGSGVAWIVALLLLAHAALYALALWGAAALVARGTPQAVRAALVWVLVAGGFVVAIATEPYRTPFDDSAARAGWIGLFQ